MPAGMYMTSIIFVDLDLCLNYSSSLTDPPESKQTRVSLCAEQSQGQKILRFYVVGIENYIVDV